MAPLNCRVGAHSDTVTFCADLIMAQASSSMERLAPSRRPADDFHRRAICVVQTFHDPGPPVTLSPSRPATLRPFCTDHPRPVSEAGATHRAARAHTRQSTATRTKTLGHPDLAVVTPPGPQEYHRPENKHSVRTTFVLNGLKLGGHTDPCDLAHVSMGRLRRPALPVNFEEGRG
jgi:hypothetical protein